VSTNRVNISINPSKPIAQLSPSPQLSFTVSLRNIQELNGNRGLVYFADMQSRNFTSTKTESSPTSEKWTFNTTLENRAEIIVVIQHFTSPTLLVFADTPMSFAANTLKVNIKVRSWPFASVQNSLAFVMDAKSPAQGVSRSTLNSQGNVEWLMIEFEGYSLYGQFFPYAVVDNRTRFLPFTLNTNDYSVTAIAPHFWDEIELDPSYSVLLGDGQAPDPNHGGGKHVNKTALIASLVIIGILALAVTALYVAYPRIKLELQLREGRASVEMEKKDLQGTGRRTGNGEGEVSGVSMEVCTEEGQLGNDKLPSVL